MLAAHDLRDTLVAHAEDAGDRGHRQPGAVGGADRPVALGPQLGGPLLDLGLAPRVDLGELGERRLGVRSFAGPAGDPGIVRVILANRLA
jgi:hypothetical protein